jgi:transposase
VKPYLIKEKNDLNDAVTIREPMNRTNARLVEIKTEAQQAILMVHRVRSKSISTRTVLMNQIRGRLAKFGSEKNLSNSLFSSIRVLYVSVDFRFV